VAALLRERWLSLALGLGGAVHVALTMLGIGGMSCPMLRVAGLPCPGCGISRASAGLISGDWAAWVEMHLLAPLFLMAIVLLLAGGLLPARARLRLMAAVEQVERKTGLTLALLVAVVAYWALRLAGDPAGFAGRMSL
jgi:hypothetical protein